MTNATTTSTEDLINSHWDLKVADLRRELRQRGLPVGGVKRVLQERLGDALRLELEEQEGLQQKKLDDHTDSETVTETETERTTLEEEEDVLQEHRRQQEVSHAEKGTVNDNTHKNDVTEEPIIEKEELAVNNDINKVDGDDDLSAKLDIVETPKDDDVASASKAEEAPEEEGSKGDAEVSDDDTVKKSDDDNNALVDPAKTETSDNDSNDGSSSAENPTNAERHSNGADSVEIPTAAVTLVEEEEIINGEAQPNTINGEEGGTKSNETTCTTDPTEQQSHNLIQINIHEPSSFVAPEDNDTRENDKENDKPGEDNHQPEDNDGSATGKDDDGNNNNNNDGPTGFAKEDSWEKKKQQPTVLEPERIHDTYTHDSSTQQDIVVDSTEETKPDVETEMGQEAATKELSDSDEKITADNLDDAANESTDEISPLGSLSITSWFKSPTRSPCARDRSSTSSVSSLSSLKLPEAFKQQVRDLDNLLTSPVTNHLGDLATSTPGSAHWSDSSNADDMSDEWNGLAQAETSLRLELENAAPQMEKDMKESFTTEEGEDKQQQQQPRRLDEETKTVIVTAPVEVAEQTIKEKVNPTVVPTKATVVVEGGEKTVELQSQKAKTSRFRNPYEMSYEEEKPSDKPIAQDAAQTINGEEEDRDNDNQQGHVGDNKALDVCVVESESQDEELEESNNNTASEPSIDTNNQSDMAATLVEVPDILVDEKSLDVPLRTTTKTEKSKESNLPSVPSNESNNNIQSGKADPELVEKENKSSGVPDITTPKTEKPKEILVEIENKSSGVPDSTTSKTEKPKEISCPNAPSEEMQEELRTKSDLISKDLEGVGTGNPNRGKENGHGVLASKASRSQCKIVAPKVRIAANQNSSTAKCSVIPKPTTKIQTKVLPKASIKLKSTAQPKPTGVNPVPVPQRTMRVIPAAITKSKSTAKVQPKPTVIHPVPVPRKVVKAERVLSKPKHAFKNNGTNKKSSSPRASKLVLGDRTNSSKTVTGITAGNKKPSTKQFCIPTTMSQRIATPAAHDDQPKIVHWTKRPPAPMDPHVKTHSRQLYSWCQVCEVWNTEHGTKQHSYFFAVKKKPIRSSIKQQQ